MRVTRRVLVLLAALAACHPEIGSKSEQPGGAPGPTDAGDRGPPEPVEVPAKTGEVTCQANCLYVDANAGDDAGDGRSPRSAWRTLNRASASVQPGDTVLVMDGTYSSDGSVEPLVVKTSGRPDAWITFAAAPGAHPVIQIPRGPGAWGGIHLFGVAYVVVDGFEIVGQGGSITAAEAAGNDGSQATLNEVCIFVDGIGSPAQRPPVPHDLVIRNNDLHDCSAAGISVSIADAVTIAYNRVHRNGWWTALGTSGLTLFHLTDVPGAGSSGGYRNFIVGNDVFDNRNDVAWRGDATHAPGIYDGNGIIFDDGDHRQAAVGASDVQGVPYGGRTYIANNLSHGNGGRGIHVFASAHVDVVNNTTYDNLRSSSPHIAYGEIDAQESSDVNVLNNVAVNLTGKDVNHNDGVTYDYNVWQGAQVPFHGVHDVVGAAGLADPGGGDFSPRTGSPALGSGTGRGAPSLDLDGKPRSMTAVDRGAIQVTP